MSDTTKTPEEIASEVMKESEAEVKIKEEFETKLKEEPEKEEKKEEEKKEPEKEEEKKEEDKKEEPKEEKKEEEKKVDTKEIERLEKEQDKMSTRFAALSRKEKALRKREQEIEEKLKKYEELEDLEKIAKDDPAAALEKIGLTQEQLIKFMVDGDKPELKKIDKIAKELEETKKKLSEYETKASKARQSAAVDNFKQQISSVLEESADDFELLNATDDKNEIVYEIINKDIEVKAKEYERQGYDVHPDDLMKELMPIKQAAALAEQYLEEEITKYQKSKKFSPKPVEPKEEPKEEEKKVSTEPKKEVPKSEPEKKEEKTIPNTLTNSMVSNTPVTPGKTTREEDIEAVKKQFRGKLFENISDE